MIRRLAVALQVSADVLIFRADERGPDRDLRLQFEAISKFAPDEKKVIKALLEGMILSTKLNAGLRRREGKQRAGIINPEVTNPTSLINSDDQTSAISILWNKGDVVQ